ncbi:tape measure protein [Ectopseudomonas khazarica]|uniref:tape measure protein n=1 Tax=Ectopseudomonas khazarica TaxID=2502979 RepID=UPI003B9626ED
MATPIASYFASIQFRIPQGEIRKVDKHLKGVEKQLTAFQKRINKQLTLDIKLPAIKIKAFKIDELALQRNSQMSLNRVSRLLTLPINSFSINQEKLNRQVQTSMQRAANQAKIVTKTVTGNSGGYGVHHTGGYANSMGASRYHGMHLGMGAGMGVALSHYLAPTAMAYGAYRGYNALYTGNADAVSNRHAITNVVSDPNASYEENTARGKQAFDYLYSESNRLGLDAKGQAEGYQKILASGQASGLSLEQSQRLFTQLSEHATVMHLDTQKQQRLGLSISQMLAKGQVMAEELKGQAGEASSTLPSYFAKAWAEQTKSNLKGAEAMGALMKAMERGEVKSAIALKALELAAKDAQPGLARSTQTSAAEANRARNTRSYTMNEASIAGVEDGFYRVNKAISTFAADLAPSAEAMAVDFAQYLGATADFTLGLRGLAKGIPGAKQDTMKAAGEMPWWYFAQMNPVAVAGVGAYNFGGYLRDKLNKPDAVPTATQDGITRMQAFSNALSTPKGIFPLETYKENQENIMRSVMPSSGINNSTINNSPVFHNTWNIQSSAIDVDTLSRELEPSIKQVLTDSVKQAITHYPQLE